MRPTRLLVAALAAVAAAGGLLSAYRHVRADLEQSALATARIVELYGDLLDRHPDLPLAEERTRLERYRSYDLLQAARSQAGVREDYLATERRLAAQMLGPHPPEDAFQYKTFSPNGFRDFGNRASFARTRILPTPPPITGDSAADERLRQLAAARGYRSRPVALEEGLVTEGRHSLQPEAMEAWKRLKAAAAREGITLELVSAYRSPERQREIFLQRLRQLMILNLGHELSPAEIARGLADAEAERLLASSSIPGYSRHHTGYALDIADATNGRPMTEFALSRAFAWISANNYLEAKRCGFIPSYPEGAAAQGPDPEAWEYVWVGEEALRVQPIPEK